MSSKKNKRNSPKDTLHANVSRHCYYLTFEVDGAKQRELLDAPPFDFDGVKLQQSIRTTAKKLKVYGINESDIRLAINNAGV